MVRVLPGGESPFPPPPPARAPALEIEKLPFKAGERSAWLAMESSPVPESRLTRGEPAILKEKKKKKKTPKDGASKVTSDPVHYTPLRLLQIKS